MDNEIIELTTEQEEIMLKELTAKEEDYHNI